MIKSFRHKGLEQFYQTGTKRGITPALTSRLARMLDRLDASTSPQDMNLPGFGLHRLKGERADQGAVSLSGNWRLVFEFEGADATNVDYLDYHKRDS